MTKTQAEWGSIGGKAGTGKAKKRGGKRYYSALVSKRWEKVRQARVVDNNDNVCIFPATSCGAETTKAQ